MKRILFALSVICVSFANVVAQENSTADSASVVNLQGIYAGFGLVTHGSAGIKTTFNIGYLNEIKLGRATSLLVAGSLLNSLYQIYSTYPYSSPQSTGYALQLSAAAQPRLYVDYYKRQPDISSTLLNSGWFISLPLEINSSILTSTYPFTVSLFVGASVGYRYAVSRSMFLEVNGGLGTTYYNLAYFQTTPYLNLKACYTL